ncbi:MULTISPECIES: hypothetical protein [unclassified Bradyrhizobium]
MPDVPKYPTLLSICAALHFGPFLTILNAVSLAENASTVIVAANGSREACFKGENNMKKRLSVALRIALGTATAGALMTASGAALQPIRSGSA